MMEATESSDGYHAAEATRVVELIESGDRTNAVRMLATPIADYYWWYGGYTNTDRERKLRAMIDELASTNQMVAAHIAEENPALKQSQPAPRPSISPH